MKIDELTNGLSYLSFFGQNIDIKGLTIDSRKAFESCAYIAIKGFNVDGHNYIKQAIANGAKLVICETLFENYENYKDISVLVVENSRKALSKIASNFYNNPTSKFNLIGVTGTNGKTSSTYFIEKILAEYNRKTAVIGTIETRLDTKKIDFDFKTSTTPDTIELNDIFGKFIKNNVQDVIMEVSSHALELYKVADCKFKIAIFTNLTQDHLDLHKNMQNYCNAKAALFTLCEVGIFNADDKYCEDIIKNATCKIFKYSINNKSDLQAQNIKYFSDKVEFDVLINNKLEHFVLNIPARFTVYNALGAIAAALYLNIPIEIIKKALLSLKGVKGRMELVPNNKDFNIIVDYAHTPDGLLNIINAVKAFTKGKVITVFGCGGDRDKNKRPIMGEISAKLSDYTIITSDNPRTEDMESIILDIEKGTLAFTQNYEKIKDRKKAIFKAVKIAKKDDSIIIAGKGHEDYEIFKDKTIHFDDVEVAKEALKELN